MKITSVDVHILKAKLAEPFAFSQFTYTHRGAMLVAVRTDEGLTGWGEAYGPAELTGPIVRNLFGPLIAGRDPRDVEAVNGAPPAAASLSDASARHFARVQQLLTAASVPFVVDGALVRGLECGSFALAVSLLDRIAGALQAMKRSARLTVDGSRVEVALTHLESKSVTQDEIYLARRLSARIFTGKG